MCSHSSTARQRGPKRFAPASPSFPIPRTRWHGICPQENKFSIVRGLKTSKCAEIGEQGLRFLLTAFMNTNAVVVLAALALDEGRPPDPKTCSHAAPPDHRLPVHVCHILCVRPVQH